MDTDEVIESAKLRIENLFSDSLNIKEYGFLFRDTALDNNCTYKINVDKFVWKQLSDIEENKNDWLTYFVTLKLDFEGEVLIHTGSKIITTEKKKFDLFIDLRFKTERIEYNYRILDADYKLIKDYIQQIENTNKSSNNYSLLSEQIFFNEKNSLHFASEILGKPRSINININYIDNIDDICRCSQDLQYLIGEIINLRPYLSNYTSHPQYIKGHVYYYCEVSFIDKRFFFLCGVMLETLYNYWDKLGDLLAEYYPTKLNPTKIFFKDVICKISGPLNQSKNFQWLESFSDKEFKELNSRRIAVVHYKNIESEFHKLYSSFKDKKSDLENLQKEKIEIVDFLENQIKLTFKGYECTLLLIDEMK